MVMFWVLLCWSRDIFIVIREKSAVRGASFSREDVSVPFLMVCFSPCSWHEVNQRGLFLTSFLMWRLLQKCVWMQRVFLMFACSCWVSDRSEKTLPSGCRSWEEYEKKKCSRQKTTFCSLSSRHLIWATFRFVMGNLAWIFLCRSFLPVILFSMWRCLKPCARWVVFCTWTVRVFSPWEKPAQGCVRHRVRGIPSLLPAEAVVTHDHVTFSWNLAGPQRLGKRADFWMKELK